MEHRELKDVKGIENRVRQQLSIAVYRGEKNALSYGSISYLSKPWKQFVTTSTMQALLKLSRQK